MSSTTTQKMVPFLELSRGLVPLQAELAQVYTQLLTAGHFVLGPRGEAFEQDFARWLGTGFVVGCGSGTDAITLGLAAGGIGPGDEVITAANTAFPTVTAILRAGAVPRFCDVDARSLLIDPQALEQTLTPQTRALVPVHLYGNPAPMPEIMHIADRHGLWVVEDCAQAHGACVDGKLAGTWAPCGAFSFYPTKNLGALGDGGAVATNDADVAHRLRELRNYGQRERFLHASAGMNSRLDEIQAAVLSLKLPYLSGWNERRRTLLARYRESLSKLVPFVDVPDQADGVAHLAVVRVPERTTIRRRLADVGIGTLVHYPVCAHLQKATAGLGYRRGDFPVAERAAEEILSLPCYPELTDAEQDRVIETFRSAVTAKTGQV